MNPIFNPYAPGAGAQPPELAGRSQLLLKASISLQRISAGYFEKGIILTGLRGVGKTVLLNRIRQEAEALGMLTLRLEVPEGRSLPSLLAPGLKSILLKLDKNKAATDLVKRGLSSLVHFVSAMKLKYGDMELGVDIQSSTDTLTNTNLDDHLVQLFQVVGEIAKEKQTPIVLVMDELHVLEESQLASLIFALHRVAQDALPITIVAAGLPQILARMGAAKTYAERLFEFPLIGMLDRQSAIQALTIPAQKLGVKYTLGALDEIILQTQGYAYFLQEWGKHAWSMAETSPIRYEDVKKATELAINELDASFFRVRFDQLTLAQKRYLHAMASLDADTCPSGQIAHALDKKVTGLASVRDQLISKGLIYSPSYGETAFTVPLFGAFMRRIMPQPNNASNLDSIDTTSL